MANKLDSPSQSDICEICNRIAEIKCSSCKLVSYCSQDHLKDHCKEHLKNCIPIKICKDDILGRHYIATRKIDIGEVILEEVKPLISAPFDNTCPLCLNCYSILTTSNAQPCVICGWPLCNQCNTHGSECEFTIKHRGSKVSIKDFGVPHPTYRCIGTIRALALRQNDPEIYNKFINLDSFRDRNEEENSSTSKKKEFWEIAKFVQRFFKLNEEIKLEEIIKILWIFQINAHEVPTSENSHMAVYDMASYFEHNCRANSSKSFTANNGIIITAARQILKGEHISLCYTDPLWGVTNRRHHLLQTKFFDCMCERCCDPTEFGTMFNALKCNKGECHGVSLPSTFSTTAYNPMKEFPNYICLTCQKPTMSWRDAELILEKIGIELATMKKNDINTCYKFIQRNRKIIHDNHYYMIDVKLALVQLIGQQNDGLSNVSNEILIEKISICKSLDHLLCVIVPAENRIRGLILFELHAALMEYSNRQGKKELNEILTLAKNVLTQAYQLLRFEPEILPEGKIAHIAKQNIREMNTIMNTLSSNFNHLL